MTKIRYRFPEFHLDWKEDEFKGIFDFHQTNTFSRSQMNNRREFTRNIHYGDILTKYGNILSDLQEVPYINKDISLLKFKEESYLQNGDIIIADTAEDLTVGKAIEVQNIDGKVLSGLHTILCRPKFKFAPRFLGYNLNSSSYRRNLIPLVAGVKVCSISKTNISKTLVMYPDDINEQQKIADCLSSIDDLISAEEKKLSLLNDYKKGWMQKLFPAEGKTVPEWRFPEFKDSGEWGEKKLLDEIGNFIRGLSYSSQDITDDKTKLLVIRSNNIIPMGKTDYINNLRFVDKECSNEQKLISGDITICMANGSSNLIGKSSFYDGGYTGDITVGVFCGIFRSSLPIVRYLFQTNQYNKELQRISQGGDGAIANLKEIDIKNIEFLLPILSEEQEKITNFLSGIDDLISKQKDKIEEFKQHKKALMQGLFPSLEDEDV